MDLHPEMVDATMELQTVHAHYQQGDFAEAATLCDHILDTYARHGLTVGPMPARVLQSRGAALIGAGKPDEAMKALGRGIAVLGPPGAGYDDPVGRGRLLATTGHALRTLGRYGPAREAYEMAIPLLREDPDEGLIAAINSLGALISHLGDTGRAKALYEEAWREMQEVEVDEDQQAWILLNLGGACGDMGELPVAVGHLEAALASFRSTGNRAGECQALLSLSDLYGEADDIGGALRLADEAVEAARLLSGEGELLARCFYRRETVAAKLARPSAGIIPGLRECVEVITAVAPAGRDAFEMRTSLAAHLLADGRPEEAISVAEAGLEAAESLRREAGAGSGKRLIGEASARAYDTMAFALLVARPPDHRERLVSILERRRGRWLLDSLGAATDRTGSGQPATERLRDARAEASRTRQMVHRARVQLDTGESGEPGLDADALEHADVVARHRLELLEAELGSEVEEPSVLSCADIQARLGPDQAILHCVTTPMACAVITVTTGQLRLRELEPELSELTRAVGRLVAAASTGAVVDDGDLDLLSAQLLADVGEEADELIVICDGPLHRLPWGLLRDPQRPSRSVATTRSLCRAVSATTHLALADRDHRQAELDLLLVGNPTYTAEQFPDPRDRRLAGTAEELAAIASTHPAHTLLSGTEATEARVVAELPRHRRVHLACHGIGDDRSAAFSGLVLAPPGRAEEATGEGADDVLEAWEIGELDVPAETVVLASCSTAGGAILRGEGLVGLAHAFHRAGTRQVLAALWPIDDKATARFMAALYANLGEDRGLADALRLTCEAFATERPKLWAPWIVFGPPGPERASP